MKRKAKTQKQKAIIAATDRVRWWHGDHFFFGLDNDGRDNLIKEELESMRESLKPRQLASILSYY